MAGAAMSTLWEPQALAAELGITLPAPSATPDKKGRSGSRTGSSTAVEAVDLDNLSAVRAELDRDTGDRSADTYRVTAACYDAGLNQAQTNWVVRQRRDLRERLDERDDDDLLTCWLKVIDERQNVTWVDNITPKDAAVAKTPAQPAAARVIKWRTAADITDDIPDWAWRYGTKGRLQLGTLGLFAGRPAAGKSTAARWFAAGFSRGTLDGYFHGKPQHVAYIASEESIEHMVKPGLRAADADMSRIHFPEVEMNGKQVRLLSTADEDELTRSLTEMGITIVIVDPVMSTVSAATDINKNNEVRAYVEPWARIAQKVKGLAIGVAHLNKGANGDVVAAINGSSAFGEVARAVIGFVKDPNSDERVLSQAKNSAGYEDLSLSYRIESMSVTTDSGRVGEVARFVIVGESARTVGEVLRDAATAGRLSDRSLDVLDFVRDNGPVSISEVDTHLGVSSAKTLQRLAAQSRLVKHSRGQYDVPNRTKGHSSRVANEVSFVSEIKDTSDTNDTKDSLCTPAREVSFSADEPCCAVCTEALWAPASIDRGLCEHCRLTDKRGDTTNQEGDEDAA
jgi:hypothetical protein